MYIYEMYYVSFVISCYVFTHLSHNYSPAEGISTTINQDILQKCLQGLYIEQTGGNQPFQCGTLDQQQVNRELPVVMKNIFHSSCIGAMILYTILDCFVT
jgi:hypothetical protein